HHYLDGRDFIIETDHCPLCDFHRKKSANGRIDRWSIKLSEFNIIAIKHKRGKCNCDADLLSRYPIDTNNVDTQTTTRTCLEQNVQFGGCCGAITRSMKQLVDNKLLTTPAAVTRTRNELPQASSATNDQGNLPPIAQIFPFEQHKIKAGQQHDAYIQQKIHKVSLEPNSDSLLKDGVLYKCLTRNGQDIQVPYVPAAMVHQLLYHAHDHPTAGHFGRDKTWNNLKNIWYWPKMYNSIQNYIKSCDQCARFNIRRSKQPGHLQPIKAPEGVMEMIGLDFCGPTQMTENGNRYIIVATDYLSKYVIAKATPDCIAKTAAQFLVHDVSYKFGIPNQILTDNGSHFVAEIFQHVAKLMGCNRILATPYHPQTNGQVERFNNEAKIVHITRTT
ncbi:unnamed protein product, partial [Didymodactylos carnosus]